MTSPQGPERGVLDAALAILDPKRIEAVRGALAQLGDLTSNIRSAATSAFVDSTTNTDPTDEQRVDGAAQSRTDEERVELTEQLRVLLASLGEQAAPLLRILPQLALVAGVKSSPALTTLSALALFVDLFADGQQEQSSSDVVAAERMASVQAHEAAGFSREEALALVLQDSANAAVLSALALQGAANDAVA